MPKVVAAFFHNHRYCLGPDGVVYSPGCFGNALWGRYLSVFDQLRVVGRSRVIQDNEDLTKFRKSNCDRVDFSFVPNLSSPILFLKNRYQAHACIEEEVRSSDVVIVRGAGEIAHMASTVALRLNKPLLVEVVGCAWDSLWWYGGLAGKCFAPVNYFRTKRMVRHANFVSYVSSHFLQNRYPACGSVLSASNVEIHSPSKAILDKRFERISAFKPESRIVLGLIGSLSSKYKGLNVALDALCVLKQKYPMIQLNVLGEGDTQYWHDQVFRRNLQHNVVFCGTLTSQESVLAWLDDVDVYIQPSLAEGVPRALIEAMSRGCPALGSSAGGIPELLAEDWTHVKGCASSLAKHLNRLVSDKDLMFLSAKRNFYEAQQYDKRELDLKRYDFLVSFRDNALNDASEI